ncbi:hypothetical protein CHS0354_042811 [Potamilus streckersoni]|uniref:Uncharacterized protein n=1 Tax=Potamilus streckersoni TaxID=2493646 RepID=A0AAE0W873_9BIVA|nr:hypothetical protein CHS0354_042811 [Potamilus streckersoni]
MGTQSETSLYYGKGGNWANHMLRTKNKGHTDTQLKILSSEYFGCTRADAVLKKAGCKLSNTQRGKKNSGLSLFKSLALLKELFKGEQITNDEYVDKLDTLQAKENR